MLTTTDAVPLPKAPIHTHGPHENLGAKEDNDHQTKEVTTLAGSRSNLSVCSHAAHYPRTEELEPEDTTAAQQPQDKTHKCGYCFKRFDGPSSLKVHMRVHTGYCSCYRTIKAPGSFEDDTDTGHSFATNAGKISLRMETWPSTCVSSMCASLLYVLLLAMSFSTGEMPFQCRCLRRFRQSGTFKR